MYHISPVNPHLTSDDKDARIRRGDAAARLLADETVAFALGELRKEQAALWAGSNPADRETREDAYRMTRCIDLLKLRLESYRADAVLEKQKAADILRQQRELNR